MAPQGLFVNLGSGPHAPPGWVCIDGSWQAWLAAHPLVARAAHVVTGRPVGHWCRGIVCRDVRRGLGLASGSAAAIFSSHLIEHLHRSEALELLRDCRRVLKPGGVCRIVTPDLAALIGAYEAARANGSAEHAADALQRALLLHPPAPHQARGLLALYRSRTSFDDHKWVYDAPGLVALFREAGFDSARERAHLESEIPQDRLSQVEEPSRILDGAGMCVEAVK